MAKNLKYFMRERSDEVVTVPGPDTFKDETGKPINLEIKVLSAAEIRKIDEGYRRRSIALDKKGSPYIANGEVVFKVEKDNAKAMRHIIVEALVYPDLKDKALMDFYKCVDVTDMPQLVFSRADEYASVSKSVFAVLGLGGEVGDTDESADFDAAKN